jgi:hypothetical protein
VFADLAWGIFRSVTIHNEIVTTSDVQWRTST